MIRCAIVDDDEMSRKALEHLVRRIDWLELVAICDDPVEAASMLRRERPELLFLDVEMPSLSGIDLIKTLQVKPEIILVTSKPDYAVEAFEYDVADYIVKPPTFERLLKALGRVQKRLAGEDEAPTPGVDAIFVKIGSQLVRVKTADIQWVEAFGDYVHVVSDQKHLVHSTMKGMENRLPADQFIRVHRSYIVRLDKIKAIEESVVIIGRQLIPIGDSYRAGLLKRLNTV